MYFVKKTFRQKIYNIFSNNIEVNADMIIMQVLINFFENLHVDKY